MELFESNGEELVSVDIQPEYADHIPFSISEFAEYVEDSEFSKVHFLYNGEFTLDMIEENEYKMWLMRNGFSQEVIRNAYFFDKGYGYFRDCMAPDSKVRGYVVRFIRYMWKNKLRDSRDISDEVWENIDIPEVKEFLEGTVRQMYIPQLMDYLVREVGSNPILVGGHVIECLKEVRIAVEAINKSYTVNNRWTYP